MNMTSKPERMERLQVAISLDELKAIDDFRFRHRMPSRTAAVRELLRRGLAASESQ
jgi:metal-responsive CopG/Arc/MetJ family transcriptional regulator